MSGITPTPQDVEAVVYSVVQDVCELDYTSPEDQPDLVMMTVAELETILRERVGPAIAQARQAGAAEEAARTLDAIDKVWEPLRARGVDLSEIKPTHADIAMAHNTIEMSREKKEGEDEGLDIFLLLSLTAHAIAQARQAGAADTSRLDLLSQLPRRVGDVRPGVMCWLIEVEYPDSLASGNETFREVVDAARSHSDQEIEARIIAMSRSEIREYLLAEGMNPDAMSVELKLRLAAIDAARYRAEHVGDDEG